MVNVNLEAEFAETLNQIKTIPQEPSVRYRGLLLNDPGAPIAKFKTRFEVRNEDCLGACERLCALATGSVGLLNMASDLRPGGGVLTGAKAQEEDICRRTTLYPTLAAQSYPLAPDELIFTPDVQILGAAPPGPRIQVVSAAAVRRPKLAWNGTYMPADLHLMRKKVQMVLETFEYHGVDHLVLGAWGCGAFRNPPEEVAQIFYDALTGPRFAGRFKHVAFAITTGKPNEDANMRAFGKAFRGLE
jgi:uncharacterized protein (TIGR02452 family)